MKSFHILLKQVGRVLTLLFLYELLPMACNGNGDVKVEGQIEFTNRVLRLSQTTPFFAYISSNKWRLILRKSATMPNSSDLSEAYDGTNRITYFEVDTNVLATFYTKSSRFTNRYDHKCEVVIKYGNGPKPEQIPQNMLWFALASQYYFLNANSNSIDLGSIFPSVGLGDYVFDQTNRYECKILAYLPGSGLPASADFTASLKLWNDEHVDSSLARWPFRDGYLHAHYEVQQTQIINNVIMPTRFTCSIFWPQRVVGLKDSDELYSFTGEIHKYDVMRLDEYRLFFPTNDEATFVRDYRIAGRPITYSLAAFAGVPDTNATVVKDALANASKLATLNHALPVSSARTMTVRMLLLLLIVAPAGLFCLRLFRRYNSK
jgi:hypothetical protein